jgi:hypothetical protein
METIGNHALHGVPVVFIGICLCTLSSALSYAGLGVTLAAWPCSDHCGLLFPNGVTRAPLRPRRMFVTQVHDGRPARDAGARDRPRVSGAFSIVYARSV